MFSSYLVIVLSCLVFAEAEFKGKHLPNYIIPCSKSSPDFEACATEQGKKVIPAILKGDKKFKIPVLVPLHLDKVEVKPGNSFELILTNISLYGLDNLKLKSVRLQEEKKHVEVEMDGDGIRIMSDYKVNGQILVLPITGEGQADFKFDECHFKYSLDYDLVEKSDGKKYGVIVKPEITFKINKAKFYLDNLFNGNKELGDNMNKVLNENFEAVLKDLGGAASQIIETIASRIITAFLGTIPYEEILLP